jgi:esterase/lipase
MARSKTIVLIHGNFVNNNTWTEWKGHYEEKGYKVYAPANPGHEGNPADLRVKVHPDLTKTGFKDVVDNIVKLSKGISWGTENGTTMLFLTRSLI